MKILRIISWIGFLVLYLAPLAAAHTPLMACFGNGDGTITCNGGFSDGSSASGVVIKVVDGQEKVLMEGSMDEDSEYTFEKPKGVFTVIFDAGPGHVVKEKSDNISE